MMPILPTRLCARAHIRPICVTLAIITLLANTVQAQTPPPAGSLVGRVLDAATSQAVPAATVTLEPTTPGLTVDPRNAVVLASVRTIVTGESGAYRFNDVTPGLY